jgi:hypothetical protein
MNDRIQAFLDAGWLTRRDAPDREVVGLWTKATRFVLDARRLDYDDDLRLIRAYDAGRIAATALVRANGFRVQSQNHHELVLRTAGLLGTEVFARLLDDFNRVRTLRAQVEYSWEEVRLGERLIEALSMAERIVAMTGAELRKARPDLASELNQTG